MKWFAGTLGGFFLGLLGLSIFIIFYVGYFNPVDVQIKTEEPLGPYQTLYKEVVGPYHKITEHLLKIENLAKAQGLPCPRTFGRFLDDPQNIDHDRLRSEVGCLFDSSTDLSGLVQNPTFQEMNLKASPLEMKSYIMGSFQGSPAIVTFKVYPKILKMVSEQRLKISENALEIYEIHGDQDVTTKVIFEIIP